MNMTPENALKLFEKHGSYSAAARAAKMDRSTFTRLVKRARPVERPKRAGMSKDEFMATFDPTTRTRKAMERVIKEYVTTDRYIKDQEMRKLAGVGDAHLWRDIADDPEEGFNKYQFEFGNARWWTTPECRSEMLKTNPKAKAV